MNLILRLFLTFSSVSLFIVVFLIHNKINFYDKWGDITYYIYFLAPFIFTYFSIQISKLLSVSTVNKILEIEVSNNDFLANYLAFFFVALSITDSVTFWIIFLMILLFTFFSRVSYFNPILLVYGYNFFYVKTGENIKVMLITKRKLKDPKVIDALEVRRINDYTFIEV